MALNILFVDDEAELLDVYSELFNDSQRNLFFADNVDSAIELINHHKMDVIFSDYRMPNKNGLELVKAIQRNTKFYVVTGEIEFESLKKVAGVSGVLIKPVKPADIEKILGELARR